MKIINGWKRHDEQNSEHFQNVEVYYFYAAAIY